MNAKIILILAISASALTQTGGGGSTSKIGSHCKTRYATGSTNQGCSSCYNDYYLYRMARRVLSEKDRFLQIVSNNKYSCKHCPTGMNGC